MDPSYSIFKKFNPENILRFDHLTPLEKSKIIPPCHEYKDIMYHEGCDLSFTSQTKQKIRTKTDRPIYVKSFRHPPLMNITGPNHKCSAFLIFSFFLIIYCVLFFIVICYFCCLLLLCRLILCVVSWTVLTAKKKTKILLWEVSRVILR